MTGLKEGNKAPLFTAPDQDGRLVSLKDFLGRKLAVYFYPHDDTPTCTTQACNLRDNYRLLQKQGYQVIGISTDSVKSHKKFEKKYGLPFPLLADEGLQIVKKYGVWGEKKFMGRIFDGTHRTTFLIDEQGKISHIIEKPVSKNHAKEILTAGEAG